MTTMMRSPPVPFKADGHNYRPELTEPTRSNRLVCLKTPSGKPNWAFKSTPIWCIMFALLLVTIVISLLIIERQQYGLVVADNDDGKVHVRIGVLLEESDHEQANMFIRTIKMINERKDETIRQLLGISAAKRPLAASDTAPSGAGQGGGQFDAASGGGGGGGGRQRRQASERSQWTSSSWLHDDDTAARSDDDAMAAPEQESHPTASGSYSIKNNINNNNNNNQVTLNIAAAPNASQHRMSRRASSSAPMQDHNRPKELNIKLEPMIEFLADRRSALEADGKVCQLIESGVHAIVGPTEGASIQHVQSICDNLEIPYFELRPFLGGAPTAPLASVSFVPSATIATSQAQLVASSDVAGGSPAAAAKASSETIERRSNSWPETSHSGATPTTTSTTTTTTGAATSTTRRQQQKLLVAGQNVAGNEATAKRPLDNDVDHPGDSGLLNASKWPSALGEGGENDDDDGPPVILGPRNSSTLSSSLEKADFEDIVGLPISDSLGRNSKQEPNFSPSYSSSSLNAAKGPDETVTAGNNNNNNNGDYGSTGEPRPGSSWPTLDQWPSSANNNNNNRNFAATAAATNNKLEDLTLNLYPPSQMLTSAYIDMIYALNWTSFAIVYEDGSSMIKLQDLFKESSGTWSSKWAIKLFRYDPNSYDSWDESSSSSSKYPSFNGDNNPNYNSNQNFHQRQEAAGTRSGGHHQQHQQQHVNRQPPPVASALTLSTENTEHDEQQRGAELLEPKERTFASKFDGPSQQFDARNTNHDHASDLIGSYPENTNDEIKFANHQQRQGRRHLTNDNNNDDSDNTNDNLYLQDAPASQQQQHHQQQQTTNKLKSPTAQGNTFRDVFWRVKLNGELNILLDVKTENLYEALKQAQQVGCMTEEYSYLITSLDLHTIDLEDFKYSRTKITGFSLIQVAKSEQSISREMFLGERMKEDKIDDGKLAKLQHLIEASGKPFFDEKYLENLGIVHPNSQSDHHLYDQHRSNQGNGGGGKSNGRNGRLSYSANGASGARYGPEQQRMANGYRSKATNFNELNNDNNNSNKSASSSSWSRWSNEAIHNDLFKREMLQSSPASLGLLPTVDRNNEQRLFDFFLQQQELNLSRVRLSTSSAILHDSLLLYMLALYDLDPNGHLLANHQPISCSLDSQPWPHGSSMVNYMRQISFTGLTGPIQFDEQGLRANFKLDILGMAPNIRLVKVGEWHSRHAIDSKNKYFHSNRANQNGDILQSQSSLTGNNYNDGPDFGEKGKSYDEISSGYDLELKRYTKMLTSGLKVEVPYSRRMSPNGALLVNDIIFERLYRDQADQIDTLIVTAKLSQPYFMLKETPNKLDGNDQYEGYAVDLIHELSKLVNFKYRWREVADKKYGSKETLPNGTVVWNGMIGEIVRGQADLAIVDLTITAQREEAVDFTLPFMNTGISILFKKPTTKVTTLFSFLSPFSSDVWAYVLAAYCGISAILFLVGHLSPYEWADPHPCRHLSDDDETVLKNQFSLLNSFWFTIGSLMQQGSDLTPRSMSTRTIAGIWYFFTLIMISSYTANLAAFLTVEKVVYPIENVRDLSNQQEIKYGCVESGSTCLFFHDSQIDTYKKINETMRSFRTYVRSNDEGQKKVGEGKFAFFMESTTIEYIIERNCNLTQIGGLIDSKGYGLATSKKSRHKRPYRTLLNEGILHLQETGMLHVLKNRWWKERRGGGTCTDDGKGGGVTELSLANVGGVFVVLLGGLGISFLVAIAEFMWRARRSGSTRDRMCEEMMNDLKFALACKSSTKPNTRTNGRSSRRGLRQQESFLSQYEDLNPATLRAQLNSPQFNAKECDPILLHAMLTMLMQQQQHHHLSTQTGISHSMSMPFASLDLPGKHELVNNMIQQRQQYELNSPAPVQHPHYVTGNNNREFRHSATLNGIANSNHYESSEQGASRRANQVWNQSVASNERRRNLHTQQTIDITDDFTTS